MDDRHKIEKNTLITTYTKLRYLEMFLNVYTAQNPLEDYPLSILD
jgi:hypothetical protein